jgi:hypothetical protein
MTMPFEDELAPERLGGLRTRGQPAGIRAQPHRAAECLEILAGEDVDDGIRRGRIELG